MAGHDEVDRTDAVAPEQPEKRSECHAAREAAFFLRKEGLSYAAIAGSSGFSPRTVERWARDGAWKQRLRAIEPPPHGKPTTS